VQHACSMHSSSMHDGRSATISINQPSSGNKGSLRAGACLIDLLCVGCKHLCTHVCTHVQYLVQLYELVLSS
jgi:hypothetical protein